MIYKWLAVLFNPRYTDGYKAHPLHVVFSLFIMAVGTATFVRDGWAVFGTVAFIIGAGLGFSIVIGIGWDKSIEYWSTLESFANVMIKSNNPDLWMALGFKAPPSKIMIEERKTDDKGNFTGFRYNPIPVSPAIMQSIADKVLMTGKTEFLESDYANIPNIRKVRNELKEKGYIIPKNKKNVRLGYTWNKKGLDILYEYASDGIKMELKRR